MYAVVLLVPGSALGAEHGFLENLGSANEPTFSAPEGLAIDQSTGDVLVADAGTGTVSRFHEDGTPSEFSALGSNEITGLTFGGPGEVEIAVDNSGGATDGNLYVPQAGAKVVDIFSSTGELIGELTESSEGEFNEPCGVAVDPSGNLYVADFSEHIHKYEPAANPPVNGDNTDNFELGGVCTLAAGAGPSEGFIFATQFFGSISKLDATTGVEQYKVDSDLNVGVGVDPTTGNLYSGSELSGESVLSEFNASGPFGATELPPSTVLPSFPAGIAVNGSTGNVYVVREGSPNVEVFAPGSSSTPEFELAIKKGGNGEGTVTGPGINCGGECSAEFEEGTEVELEATAAAKSEFAGWNTVSGDPGTCTGTASPCTVTLNEATELEAEFNRIAPVVTEVNPTKGPSAGGNTVEIVGTELSEATKVEFGTTEATILGNTETSVEVEAPAHAAGTVDVTVTTPGGASTTSSADEYTFVDAPTVTEVNPVEGSTAGGELVEIVGTHLEEASKVTFGGSEATIIEGQNTDTTIEVETPQHAAGTFHVVVTAIGGTSTETAADEFTFIASPAVTGVSPNKGPTTGGNLVEITGLRLGNASKVEFGTTEATILENNETSIEVEAPEHAAGTVDVRVTTLGGTSGKFPQDKYTYEVPTHTLTVNKAGSGSGSVSCNGGGCAPSYPEGTKVTLAASPAAGSSFGGWSGGGCSGTGTCTVTLNANVTVTATFSANPPPPPPPPPPVECVVPKLKGLSLEKAKSALRKAHCKPGKVTKPKNKKGPLVVKSSKPGEGAKRPAETKVELKLGPKPKKK